MKPTYEVLYVMFNEDKIFENYEEALAYAKEYGGKVSLRDETLYSPWRFPKWSSSLGKYSSTFGAPKSEIQSSMESG